MNATVDSGIRNQNPSTTFELYANRQTHCQLPKRPCQKLTRQKAFAEEKGGKKANLVSLLDPQKRMYGK